MKIVGMILGAVLLAFGGFVLLLVLREMYEGAPGRPLDLAAAAVLGGCLTALGVILAFFDSGRDIDERARVVRQWCGWRGLEKQTLETPFDRLTRISLEWSPHAKFTPGRWRIMADVRGLAPIELGFALKLDEALRLAHDMATRTGVRFPAGQTHWTGERDCVHCDVSLGSLGLTVGEYADNPHDLNQSLTASLDEFLAATNQGAMAREIIRERLGPATLTEVLEAAQLRQALSTSTRRGTPIAANC